MAFLSGTVTAGRSVARVAPLHGYRRERLQVARGGRRGPALEAPVLLLGLLVDHWRARRRRRGGRGGDAPPSRGTEPPGACAGAGMSAAAGAGGGGARGGRLLLAAILLEARLGLRHGRDDLALVGHDGAVGDDGRSQPRLERQRRARDERQLHACQSSPDRFSTMPHACRSASPSGCTTSRYDGSPHRGGRDVADLQIVRAAVEREDDRAQRPSSRPASVALSPVGLGVLVVAVHVEGERRGLHASCRPAP